MAIDSANKDRAAATERGYPDLQDHVRALEDAGLLLTIDAPINKDTEMHPLVRWQFRGGIPESERKAFLFTNITDSRGRSYDTPVVIGALAYFGLLSPTRYLPARCDFGAQLKCADYALQEGSENGCVLLQFQNNFGVPISVHDVTLTDGTGALSYGSTPNCGGAGAGAVNVSPGNVSEIFSLDIPTGSETFLVAGDRSSVRVRVTFSRAVSGAPLHNLTGEIFATASTG